MRFTIRQDIAAPIAQVFAALIDVTAHERRALRRGAEVRRLDRLPAIGPGASWHVGFAVRGRDRDMTIEVARLEAPTLVAAAMAGGGLSGVVTAELLSLSRTTTRLAATLDVKASTLATRLLVQALRLGRGAFERRAATRMAPWARDVEARWQRRAGQGGEG